MTRKILQAGPVSVLFENGGLRYIRAGGREVLRRIYFAVRDRTWGTVPAVISNLRMNVEVRSFRVEYEAVYRDKEIDFRASTVIVGGEDGSIVWKVSGEAAANFLKNRIGLCVLHPIEECAGQPCEVEHTDGSVEQGCFPFYIAPHQPFRNVRSILHRVQPDLLAKVEFAGAVFEMEDQRNWTDASYKTYSTPLDLPFPTAMTRGERVEQSVRVAFRGPVPARSNEAQTSILIEVFDSVVPLPEIGFVYAGPMTGAQMQWLRALRPAHLRIDLNLAASTWKERLASAAECGIPLECAVVFDKAAPDALKELACEVERLRVGIRRWLILRGPLLLAREHLPSAEFTVGTDTHFAELNRQRPGLNGADGICFPITPQVHAFDDASLVENLAAQAWAVDSARQFAEGRRIAVTPVTLRPAGKGSDPRQKTDFGAAWTLGSLKYLAEAGAASVTFFETSGDSGMMDGEGVFPLYRVFAEAAKSAGSRVRLCKSSDPLSVEALAFDSTQGLRVLAANLSGKEQKVECRFQRERTIVDLPPYGLAEL